MERKERELLNKFWVSTFGLNTDTMLDKFAESAHERLLAFFNATIQKAMNEQDVKTYVEYVVGRDDTILTYEWKTGLSRKEIARLEKSAADVLHTVDTMRTLIQICVNTEDKR